MQHNHLLLRRPVLGLLAPYAIAVAIVLLSQVVRADVITLIDGRLFEGQTLSDQGEKVQFDTLISGIRAKLSFKRSDVKSLEKKALPAGFFEGSESDPASAAQGPTGEPTLYLEIPITGGFKDQVFAQAVRSSLFYARGRNVKHIVFTVDSNGGALDEAGILARVLRDFRGDLSYHAIIRNCTGEAIIVPFMCESIHLLPGAVVGGSDQKMENLPAKFAKKDEAVVRSQIADDLAEEARKLGRKGDVIRAMVDPTESLAAWLDPSGKVVMDRTAPKDLPPDKLIFQDGPNTVLVLTYDQATKLGLPPIDGGPDALGKLLGLPNWKEESTYGRDMVSKIASLHRQKASAAQAKFEDSVSRNIRMRDITKKAIESNLKQAATWNPTTASYKTLSMYITWGWDPGTQWDSQIWTPDSQARWHSRSEACAYFLNRAAEGIKSMMKLDKEAVPLGLSPTFKEGDLQLMLEDVNVKLEMLRRGQFRVGE
jgi:hypothetical protein